MVFRKVIISSLLLAAHASATLSPRIAFSVSTDLESQLRRDAEASFERRQLGTTPASGDASRLDLDAWNAATRAACDSALATLNGIASNPSGLAVCYNLPFLDNTTGIFQAELRMYNISAPRDEWAGVTASGVSMTLSYLGATVQQMNVSSPSSSNSKRDGTFAWDPMRRSSGIEGMLVEKRQSTDTAPAANAPAELKAIMYVGRINNNVMKDAMTPAKLQDLLVPQIVLAATSPLTSNRVNATLSSEEASFVNGVFSASANSTNDAAAQASASAAAALAAPFELPGTKLAFFPVGLVITSVWTLLFVTAVGLGTFGRIQFRDQYRRRMQREMATGVRTI